MKRKQQKRTRTNINKWGEMLNEHVKKEKETHFSHSGYSVTKSCAAIGTWRHMPRRRSGGAAAVGNTAVPKWPRPTTPAHLKMCSGERVEIVSRIRITKCYGATDTQGKNPPHC